jgi:hypothetical protein
MEDNMRPTTAFDDDAFDLNALLHPDTVFDHPKVPHFQILDHDNAAFLDDRRDRLVQGVLAASCELRLQIAAEVDADLKAMI